VSDTKKTRRDLLGLLPEEIDELLAARGCERYRSTQVIEWLYRHGARSFAEMTNLPASLRDDLASAFEITDLKPLSTQTSRIDRTKKFLFGLGDGASVETVLLPEGGRSTVCISTQVGCSFGCAFCASGAGGFTRNLTAGEIVDQGRRARFDPGAGRLTNVVLMGTGEPLVNYDATARAVRIFQHKRGFALGKRRVTISTAGYVPGIRRLAEDELPVKLAISLHATDDAARARIMPITRKYSIEEILAACKPLAGRPYIPLTIEYMLIDGLNDSPASARALAKMCRSLKAKVNLIPCNPALAEKFTAPPQERVLAFQAELRKADVLAFIRRSRGLDIDGACGQLRAAHKRRGMRDDGR
jgi:23S rRNA (adenine2503-C2)-methyltransferase